jgi:hypothetical protein
MVGAEGLGFSWELLTIMEILLVRPLFISETGHLNCRSCKACIG